MYLPVWYWTTLQRQLPFDAWRKKTAPLTQGEQAMLILSKRVAACRHERIVYDPMGHRPVGKDIVVHFIRVMHLVKDEVAQRLLFAVL